MNRTRAIAYAMLTVSIVLAGSAIAGIQGTKHDFTATGDPTGKAYNKTSNMCGPCHVPHNPKLSLPLWARAQTAKTFELYKDNAEYTAGHAASYDSSPDSFTGSRTRACMSCHDGTIAVVTGVSLAETDSSWIMTDNGTADPVATTPQSGLKGSHPVGVTYSPAWAGYKDISSEKDIKLEHGKVQCTTCHGPHDNTNKHFLVKSNTSSAICTTCHSK